MALRDGPAGRVRRAGLGIGGVEQARAAAAIALDTTSVFITDDVGNAIVRVAK